MDGILIIDKPSGITSHDVVDILRRRLKLRKVGHCGTLDPMATGVLVVLLGRATKLSLRFSGEDKEYLCTMTLGAATDTHDATGKVLKAGDIDSITEAQIREAVLSFRGRQRQTPPMVSAKQHKGRRLYKLARSGMEIMRQPQAIEITDIDIIRITKPEVEFKIVCSKGTYIRTLCNDMGEKLGCGAHMSSLRRLRSGRFDIKEAVSLEEVRAPSGGMPYERIIAVPAL